MDLRGRSFLTLKDFTPQEIVYLIDLAAEYKDKKKKGILHDTLRGKNIALIFEKTSTRTRCSFEVAAHDLGMGTTYLDRRVPRLARRRALRIRQGCLAECLRELSTVALSRLSWRSLQSMRVCLCGMV